MSVKAFRNKGIALLEVLVTLVILLVGLLGLAGLISKGTQLEMESYQRVQALVLLEDMAERLAANRMAAECYPSYGTVGVGTTPTFACAQALCNDSGCAQSPHVDQANDDMQRWHELLQGNAEQLGGANVGAMIGARGCVFTLDSTARLYLVSVSWQGVGPSATPAAQVTTPLGATVDACGRNQYKDASGAVDESFRRTVSIPVRIATLCDASIGNCTL